MTEEQKTALRIWLAELVGQTEIADGKEVGFIGIPPESDEGYWEIPPLDLNNMPAFEAAVCEKYELDLNITSRQRSKRKECFVQYMSKDENDNTKDITVHKFGETTSRIEAIYKVIELVKKEE